MKILKMRETRIRYEDTEDAGDADQIVIMISLATTTTRPHCCH
jgi:hypothetical protein